MAREDPEEINGPLEDMNITGFYINNDEHKLKDIKQGKYKSIYVSWVHLLLFLLLSLSLSLHIYIGQYANWP